MTSAFSGDPSWTRFDRAGTRAALSRARSLSAAWADWIALEVPARDVKLGDWGFSGRGGGARSGSELSHLLLVSLRQNDDMYRWQGKGDAHGNQSPVA